MEPEVKPKHKYLPVLLTVLIMLFVVALVGGGVWYYADQQSKKTADDNAKQVAVLQKQIDDLNKKTTTVTSTTPLASSDVTSGWKTYTNSTYGLTFKYPGTYAISDVTADQVGSDQNQYPWYSRSDFVKQVLQLSGQEIQAKVVLSSSDISKTIGGFGGSGKTAREFIVNGKKAYYVTNYGQGPSSQSIEYVLVGPNYSLLVWGVNSSKNEELNSLIQTATIN